MNAKAKHRILFIEDNSTDVLLLQEAFAGHEDDYDLIHVDRLGDALERVEKEAFDLVLLDLGLPDSKGAETFLRMHQRAPNVPVLVLTALDDAKLEMEFIRDGAQDYLVKLDILAPEFCMSGKARPHAKSATRFPIARSFS